jgi:hypothetical protein
MYDVYATIATFSLIDIESAISLRRLLQLFIGFNDFRGFSFLTRKDYIISHGYRRENRSRELTGFVYADVIKLRRG